MKRFVLIAILILLFTTGCASKLPTPEVQILSPLGLYRTDTEEQFWLAILDNEQYLICDTQRCEAARYERVAVDYGVILLGFYSTATGQAIEKRIHGRNASDEFVAAMTDFRKTQSRPDDLVFNLRNCDQTACAAVGHSRDGVKFYRVESFDNYWHSNN